MASQVPKTMTRHSSRERLPTRAAPIDGALETQALDNMRVTAVGPYHPDGTFVRRFFAVNLEHSFLVTPITFVGKAKGNPFPLRRPRAWRADLASARELTVIRAIHAYDKQLKRITHGK